MPNLQSVMSTLGLFAANVAVAGPCLPPGEGAIPPAPPIDPARHALLSRTEETTVRVPVESFRTWFFAAPLEDLLPGTARVPAVVGTAAIGSVPFPEAGAMRHVCLADGSGAVERVLSLDPARFNYLVWGYTLPEAEAILYGHGQFEFAAVGDTTAVRWTYSFQLKDDRFPGWLGPIGRFLFRASFLDTTYADFMASGLRAIKAGAEQAALRAAR